MFICKISFPGSRLKSNSSNKMGEVEKLLFHMDHCFSEAVLALNLYKMETRKLNLGDHLKNIQRLNGLPVSQSILAFGKEWVNMAITRVRTLLGRWLGKDNIENSSGTVLEGVSALDWLLWRQHYEYKLLEEQWNLDRVPDKYRWRVTSIFAHAYLYALDGFSKSFRALTNESDVSPLVLDEYSKFQAAFPNLTPVRDSSHHMEDRVRMLDRRGKKISPKSNIILFGSILSGKQNELAYISEDGRNTTIEISSANVEIVRSIFQNLINCFEWEGVPRLEVY
jgi:hypothetical protein